MAIQFDFYETPDPSGEKPSRYHARTVSHRTVKTDQIAVEIQMASTLTVADIKAVLTALNDRIAFHLGESNHVHLEGIGYFQATLATTKEVDPKKTRAQSVWFKSVKFRADQELKNRLKMVRTERSGFKTHSAKLTREQVDSKVTEYLSNKPFITRRQMQQLLKMTRSTTLSHIRRMLQEEKIKNMGTRFQPIYTKP